MNIDEHKELIEQFISQVKKFRPDGPEDSTDSEISVMITSGTKLVCEFFSDVKRFVELKEKDYKLDDLAQHIYTLEAENEMLRNLIEQKDRNDKGDNYVEEETAETIEKISYHSKEAKSTKDHNQA